MHQMNDAAARVALALPAAVSDLLKRHPHLCVAGGFVRDVLIGATPKDVDVFVVTEPPARLATLLGLGAKIASDAAHEAMCEVFASSAYSLVVTDRAFTLHGLPNAVNEVPPPIQFVRGERVGFDALFRTFDFSVCRVALHWSKSRGWQIVAGDGFWADLTARRLRFCSPEGSRAASATHRLARFAARGHGWHFEPEDLAALAVARLKELGAPGADMLGAKWLQAPGEGDNRRGSG